MRKELYKHIEIPKGVEVKVDGNSIEVKGKEGELKKQFPVGNLEFKHEGNKIILGHKKSTKREKKMMNTIAAHIANMIKGVQEKFEYKLKICFSHFPFTVDIKGHAATIKNFLGEKIAREFKLPSGVDIQADKTYITITSIDKELAGQAASNFERATKVRGRDKRIFQDGIYLVEKMGREI